MRFLSKLLLILNVVLIPAIAFGQVNDQYQKIKDMEYINVIKSRVSDLLNENAALEKQNSFLGEQYRSISSKVEYLKKEIDKMVSYSWDAVGKRKDRKAEEKDLKEEYNRLQDELAVKKTSISALKGLKIDSGDSKRLGRLQLKELDYRIRELGLEVELKEKLFKEKSDKFKKQINDLENKRDEKKQYFAQLESQIAEIEKLNNDAPGEIEGLKQKFGALQKAVSDLRIERDILEKKISILESKKKLDVLLFEGEIKKKEDKKKDLESSLRELKGEYDSLDKDVKELLSSQDTNEKIISLIKEYDTENQDLRKRISELKEKLKY